MSAEQQTMHPDVATILGLSQGDAESVMSASNGITREDYAQFNTNFLDLRSVTDQKCWMCPNLVSDAAAMTTVETGYAGLTLGQVLERREELTPSQACEVGAILNTVTNAYECEIEDAILDGIHEQYAQKNLDIDQFEGEI